MTAATRELPRYFKLTLRIDGNSWGICPKSSVIALLSLGQTESAQYTTVVDAIALG